MKKKRIRVNVEISKEDNRLLEELMTDWDFSSRDIVVKGIRLLASLDNGDCELITKARSKIPNSVIFS